MAQTNSTSHGQTWTIQSILGCEKEVLNGVTPYIKRYFPDAERVEEIVTAISEACLNGMEHGNQLDAQSMVEVQLCDTDDALVFRICDEGNGFTLPSADRIDSGRTPSTQQNDYEQTPSIDRTDLDRATPSKRSDSRGWGLLFMSRFADGVRAVHDKGHFCVELRFLKPCTKGDEQHGSATKTELSRNR